MVTQLLNKLGKKNICVIPAGHGRPASFTCESTSLTRTQNSEKIKLTGAHKIVRSIMMQNVNR